MSTSTPADPPGHGSSESPASPPPPQPPTLVRAERQDTRSASAIIWWLTLGFIVIAVGLAAVLVILQQMGIFYAEVSLPLLIVASTIALITSLASAAIIFRRLGLANRTRPMGLPEGSIRAIIALLLIVIFSVISVYIIANADSQGTRLLEGLSASKADEAPIDQVLSRTVEDDGTITLTLRGDKPPSAEMSQELLTTLGTLVVAIASFYFGSQAVTSAKRSRRDNEPDPEVVVPNQVGKSDGDADDPEPANTGRALRGSRRPGPVGILPGRRAGHNRCRAGLNRCRKSAW